jgi:hypothetical protein
MEVGLKSDVKCSSVVSNAASALFLTWLLHMTSDFKTHLHPSCRILPTTNPKVQVTLQAHISSLKMA